jgi:hypothetical protein
MPQEHQEKPSVPDSEDYGGIGPEEFERRILADQEERYGDLIRNAQWEPAGEPGW